MIASSDEEMEEAVRSLFLFCTDEQVRKACRERDEYYQDLASYEREIAEKDNTIAEKEALIRELSAKLELLQKQKAEVL